MLSSCFSHLARSPRFSRLTSLLPAHLASPASPRFSQGRKSSTSTRVMTRVAQQMAMATMAPVPSAEEDCSGGLYAARWCIEGGEGGGKRGERRNDGPWKTPMPLPPFPSPTPPPSPPFPSPSSTHFRPPSSLNDSRAGP
ncbi:unnamed protein product [Closterium sp. NIES-54]